jgi:hypothetical protein
MFRSNVAMKMYLYLKVKEAYAPLLSVPAEPPTFSATLEGGAVVVGYIVKRISISCYWRKCVSLLGASRKERYRKHHRAGVVPHFD